MHYYERKRRYIPEKRFNGESNGDKHKELLQTLERQVESIHDSESYQKYLAVQSRFHKYSPGNVMLIAAQRPDATKVAGYKTWQSLGRQVLRGERGIRIMVPMPKKVENEDGSEEVTMRFGVGYVFDVAQT